MDRSAILLLRLALCLTVLVVETYSSISWPREVSHRTKWQAGCQLDEFRCTSGECIVTVSKCNGTKECADGSDETEASCKPLNRPTRASPSEPQDGGCRLPHRPEFGTYTVPSCEFDDKSAVCRQVPETPVPKNSLLSFKCNEGYNLKETQEKVLHTVCVNGKWSPKIPVCIASSQEGGCRLPQPPQFGTYTAATCAHDNQTAICRLIPGTPVPQNWALSVKCNEGHYIEETWDETLSMICVNEKWSPEIPVCRQMCSPLVSTGVDVLCFNGENYVDCTKTVRPGTRAKAECKPFYSQIRPPPYTEIICRDSGKWSDELFNCQPVCGKRNKQGVNNPLIVRSSGAQYGEFPWHVGLYRKNTTDKWEQVCGGSLISPHIVLTVAHCVFSEPKKALISPEEVKVGLGKYYREWTRDEPYSVHANVREILIPPRYSGVETNFVQDIAILDLMYSVQVHVGVMPVCVDWKSEFTVTPGMLGTLAGWGYTEKGKPSDVLLYADLPYINYQDCIAQVPRVFRRFVTADKFCAGFHNVTGGGKGDTGGGLTFVQDDLHYVYGTLSVKQRDVNSLATFTNISNVELLNWVIYSTQRLDEAHPKTCPPSKFQCVYGECIEANKKCNGRADCTDGSDEAAGACPGATTTQVAVFLPLKCKDREFRCRSGQCIDRLSVCDGRVNCADGSDEAESQCSSVPSLPPVQGGGCRLPQRREFAKYTAPVCEYNDKSAICRHVPGTAVPQNWLLSFQCNEGYYMKETQDENFYVFCVNGKWSPKIPICRKMCPPLVSLSVAVRCFIGEDDIDCSNPMRPGTRAKAECKPSYNQIRPPPYTEIFCRDNGQWSYELFYCQPVCGKRNKQGINTPLIIDGAVAQYGEFPWHVGLYLMNESYLWEQKCGGTLISPHIVLTAAHCVFSESVKMKLLPEGLKVGLGKRYREWTHSEPYAVYANVREILIPSRYYGQATSYTQDIALVDLADSVQVHAGIMPVCVDWKREFTITHGTLGTLAGWGRTENKTSSDILLYTDLPYIDYHNCINKMPSVFRHYVTPDKFCAGFDNGTGAASGDSGGGLTFVRDDLHYVHGIVSTKVKDANSLTTFTNISYVDLFIWLNQAKRILDEAHIET